MSPKSNTPASPPSKCRRQGDPQDQLRRPGVQGLRGRRQTGGGPRFLPVADFYADWARAEFGPAVAGAVAAIFTKLDGHIPRASTWANGPGVMAINRQPWAKVAPQYAFVDELAALRPQVQGAGNLERFDWWLNTLRFNRAMARLGCARGALDALMEKINKEPDASVRQRLAREQALPQRRELAGLLADMYGHLLATLHNASELGTICNIEQQSMLRTRLITIHDARLEKLLGAAVAGRRATVAGLSRPGPAGRAGDAGPRGKRRAASAENHRARRAAGEVGLCTSSPPWRRRLANCPRRACRPRRVRGEIAGRSGRLRVLCRCGVSGRENASLARHRARHESNCRRFGVMPDTATQRRSPPMKSHAFIAGLVLAVCTAATVHSAGVIVCPADAPTNVKLAAKEIRRYVYLRTGTLLPIAASAVATGDAKNAAAVGAVIVLNTDKSLATEQYRLRTTEQAGRRTLTLSGGSETAVLYGAYRLAEHLGVRFYLHGDVVPDKQIALGIADAGRNAQAAVRPPRHSAVPRFPRGARLVEPRRLQGDSRPVAEDGDELLRAAPLSRGRRGAGAAGVDWPARRDWPPTAR